MSETFETAAEAEDAYYDAIEEGDLEKMMSVWDTAEDIACLLPMQPISRGEADIRELWRKVFAPGRPLDITVNHLNWIEQGEMAIHLLEEVAAVADSQERQPPVYAINIYRRGENGWRMLSHINSPTPPPPGMLPPLP